MLKCGELVACFMALLLASCARLGSAQDLEYYPMEEKRDFEREFMHFGKRADASAFDRSFMHFGKRAAPAFDGYDRAFMPFGKRALTLEQLVAKKNFNRDFMHFGKRVAPAGFEREFMHFGKRR